jgi:serine/threonine protein kinase
VNLETPRLLRFGPFELDVRSGEMRKHGVRLHMPDQSFQILLMFIEHPGEVVLREEIRRKLWPNNTIVEFDHSINAAIKRLRKALGESADDPRYIETLARRGYRFLEEVERVVGFAAESSAEVEETHTDTDDTPIDLIRGSSISHYRVLEKLGSGGMGEVWKARDPRLNRDVAIKISAQQFSDRFEREARAIAALNHSNICTLYDVGPNYLVMELVEGPTLAERIGQGPLPLEEALGIARQIADALEAAHEKGIVHCDLKPANIKIRGDGSVKVLDFGLAKAGGEDAESTADSLNVLSAAGVILGTAGYMSPEQARGQKVDKRADIWAFGVVLYEMVTGRRLFECKAASDALAAVTKEPDWTLVPARLQRPLRRCLEKDLRRRLRDISGVELLLEDEPPISAPSLAEARVQSRLGVAGSIAAGVFALAVAALVFVHFRETQHVDPVLHLSVPLPGNSPPGFIALAPDGRRLVLSILKREQVPALASLVGFASASAFVWY